MTDVESIFDAEEIRRRRWILGSIPYMTQDRARDMWANKLSFLERQSAVIMYKLLEHEHVHKLFGSDPFHSSHAAPNLMPRKFMDDPNALIAFTKSKHFERGYFGQFKVPEQFRDNYDVMKAVCSKIPNCLYLASDRLKDNEEIVLTACFGDAWNYMGPIEFASKRLKSDKEFISKCFLEYSSRVGREECQCESYSWLYCCSLFWFEDSETQESTGYFSVMDMRDFLNLIPPKEAVDAALYFPENFFGDKDAVLELMGRVEPPMAEKIYRKCSRGIRKIEAIRQKIDEKVLKQDDEESEEEDYDTTRDRVLNQMSAGEIDNFKAIPSEFRIEPHVLVEAVKCGMLDSKKKVMAFVDSVRDDKELWEGRWEYWEDWEGEEYKWYSNVPDHLKVDEDIAIALLELGCVEFGPILEKLPSLYQSKRAMIASLETTSHWDCRDGGPDEFVKKSSFCGDKEFMARACRINDCNFQLADDALLDDRDFIEKVNHSLAITYSSDEFQLSNLDLVEKAIGRLGWDGLNGKGWFEDIAPEVWRNRSLVMKFMECGGSYRRDNRSDILSLLRDTDENNPLLGDKEVVSLSVNIKPSDFAYASKELRDDRKFVLQIVRETERVLHYVSKKLWLDDEMLIAAFAKNEGTLVDCFDILRSSEDLEYLSALSDRVKEKLQSHEVFVMDFLRGVSITDQHDLHPRQRSPLPMLDRGEETSTNLKQLIANYAGVPVRQSFVEMKAAAAVLQRFGLY